MSSPLLPSDLVCVCLLVVCSVTLLTQSELDSAEGPNSMDSDSSIEEASAIKADRYPLTEICILQTDMQSALALGREITRYGFSALIFSEVEALLTFLKESPLTAAVVFLSVPGEHQLRVAETYRGRCYSARDTSGLDDIVRAVRFMHREQLMIDDPGVLRILSSLDSFVDRSPGALMVNGPSLCLNRALEFVRTFAPGPVLEATLSVDPKLEDPNTFYYIDDVFLQPIAVQMNWYLKYMTEDYRVLLLESTSLDELDEAYVSGKLHESMFEKLSVQAVKVAGLGNHSVESLLVQPPKFFAPRIEIMEGGSRSPFVGTIDTPALAAGSEALNSKSPRKQSIFSKLLGQ